MYYDILVDLSEAKNYLKDLSQTKEPMETAGAISMAINHLGSLRANILDKNAPISFLAKSSVHRFMNLYLNPSYIYLDINEDPSSDIVEISPLKSDAVADDILDLLLKNYKNTNDLLIFAQSFVNRFEVLSTILNYY